MTVWAVIVAAGSGDRYGGPKQYERLGRQRVLDWSLHTAGDTCDGVVLVVHPDRVDDLEPLADVIVAGGNTRTESVRAGLAATPPDADIVVVHDAARPLATAALWRRVVDAVRDGADAVVPAVAVTDTLREVGGGTVDRSRFVAVQTPQGFRTSVLRDAHRAGRDATDDASVVEAGGGKVLVVDGEPDNRKITGPSDLVALRGLLA